MGSEIVSGIVLMVLAYLLISNADKWAQPLLNLVPTFFGPHGIIDVLQGRPGS